ncbi:putative membrane protein [Hoeflea phototrophica DFL-43]|uniref:Putative membrane protein n=1 Tax=Hoeflea phototrophica (strain DSM 17068 / NCIMB 14078 / DFL-43) TaxID=411684 RepID=A9DDI4_HOEPD|nr:NnrU family protein [Hoeflea phototrophica]EDQ32076.1 putative membrane protein [Hoeflea phototrophica DFL-43]
MIWLIVGLVLFLGVHSVRIVAPEFRQSQIEARGLNAWKGMYTAVSLLGFLVLVWGYGQARLDPVVFWVAPAWVSHVVLLAMLFAMIFLVASQVPAGKIKAAVKHPMLLAVKIWALVHLLANGDLASLFLFGGFLAWAVVDRISEKKRLQAGLTSNPVAGPIKWDLVSVVGGLALYVAFVIWLHRWFFGVSPIIGM